MYDFLDNRGKAERRVASAEGYNPISLVFRGWNLASGPRVPGWTHGEQWNYGIILCPQQSLQKAIDNSGMLQRVQYGS